jgi:HlyD family secretion protein
MSYPKPTRIILIGGVLLAAAGIAVWRCGVRPGQEDSTAPTTPVVRRDLRATVNTNGTVEPIERPEILAPIAGLVSRLQVREGAHVKAGQLLMELDSHELRDSLSQAKAALLEARLGSRFILSGPAKEEVDAVDASIAEVRLQRERADEDLRRERSLLERDATTRVAVDALVQHVKELDLQEKALDQRRRNLLSRYTPEETRREQDRISELEDRTALFERRLSQSAIRAPWDGVIYSLPVEPGAAVNPGELLARIVRPGYVRVRANVDEPELGRIRLGQDVWIQWEALPDKTWRARVERLAETVAALGSRSVGHVLCSLAEPSPELLPGIPGTVPLVVGESLRALVVPRAAVFNREGKNTVWVVERGRETARTVVEGLTTPQEVEILSGLAEGEMVVSNPQGAGSP